MARKRKMTPAEEELITQQLLKEGVLIYVPCYLCGHKMIMRTDIYKPHVKYLCTTPCHKIWHKVADGWSDVEH